ncbi:MAG: thioredoxin reductase [Solirubrobacterales bacterium]|jgi:thioredoxin reductase (NADPH)|nr:thioredoxin reductase [Solirubrobacterales bacterium]
MSELPGIGMEERPAGERGYPRLSDGQRARLRALGTVRSTSPGDVLFREGEESYDFFVVESGAVTIVQGYEKENRALAVFGARQFLGELGLLTGARVYLTAVVRDGGEVIQIPGQRLRDLLGEDEEMSSLVLPAYLARRARLINIGAGVHLIGSRFSVDSRRLREFMARNRVPYQWTDLEDDDEVDAMLQAAGVEPAETPVLIGAGSLLRNPSNAEIAATLGLGAAGAPPALCDLVIVGGGPAGLAAAVYGASEGLDTQAIDSTAFGGQASTSSRIENYLGFPAGISGGELAARALLQAEKFGARMAMPAEAVKLAREDGHYTVELADGSAVNGRTLIVATGAQYRKLAVADLERFEGLGVYYAATMVEAQMCANDPVLVVGGGNSAGQAAIYMSQRAGSCRLLIRGGDLGKSMSRYLVDEIERRPEIELMTYSQIVELRGETSLESAVIVDNRSEDRVELPAIAVFVFIGASPHTDWLDGCVAVDENGFLLTGPALGDEDRTAFVEGDAPFFLETSQPGIFAVGDVRSGSVKRVASGAGEGAMAVQLVHQRLAGSPS